MNKCHTDNVHCVGASWQATDKIKECAEYERLSCSICHDLLQKPIQHQCGQHFCKPCLDRWCNGKSILDIRIDQFSN